MKKPDLTRKTPNQKGFKRGLPTKNCKACDKPFQWRKKWKRDWDSVLYCSQACKAQSKRGNKSV